MALGVFTDSATGGQLPMLFLMLWFGAVALHTLTLLAKAGSSAFGGRWKDASVYILGVLALPLIACVGVPNVMGLIARIFGL